MNIVETLKEYIDNSIMRNKSGETYISMSVTDAHKIIDKIESLKCCGNCNPDNRDCKRCIRNENDETGSKTEDNWASNDE